MSVLSAATERQVEEKLVKDGIVTSDKLKNVKNKAEQAHTPLLSLLVQDGLVTNETLTKTVSQVTKIPYVNLTRAKIDPSVLELLPRDTAEHYMAVPLGEMQNRLVVAMLDADNVQAVDFLANKIGRPLKVYSASEEGIRQVLTQYAAAISNDVASAFDNQKEIEDLVVGQKGKDSDVEIIVQDSPISKVLTAMLDYAATHRASDIHIEPLERELVVRCRTDGVLRKMTSLPKAMLPAIVSRIKILSNLKIDEHRIPQDGQFSINIARRNIDLRIAISPTIWGEQVVIRLLDKTGTNFELEAMGYTGQALRTIREGLKRPNGMILTSGPTGSGKSTSMYAMIQEIQDEAINIVTLEDPVEYKISGVNQIQVNPEVGLTFTTGLRSILRQDPDVIMVGEIRDKETATLAVQAALTGHLVFSTLHTNSASGILPRLLDMGIEPFLIASTVHTVIGQRLIRRIDSEARETYQSNKVETEAIHATIGHLLPDKEGDVKKFATDLGYTSLPMKGQNAYTLYKGIDGPQTPDGFKGRMGLYEVFDITEAIQELIIKHSTSTEIQNAAQKQGMITMREDGYLKALAGYTTLAEVNRVAAADSA